MMKMMTMGDGILSFTVVFCLCVCTCIHAARGIPANVSLRSDESPNERGMQTRTVRGKEGMSSELGVREAAAHVKDSLSSLVR